MPFLHDSPRLRRAASRSSNGTFAPRRRRDAALFALRHITMFHFRSPSLRSARGRRSSLPLMRDRRFRARRAGAFRGACVPLAIAYLRLRSVRHRCGAAVMTLIGFARIGALDRGESPTQRDGHALDYLGLHRFEAAYFQAARRDGEAAAGGLPLPPRAFARAQPESAAAYVVAVLIAARGAARGRSRCDQMRFLCSL